MPCWGSDQSVPVNQRTNVSANWATDVENRSNSPLNGQEFAAFFIRDFGVAPDCR